MAQLDLTTLNEPVFSLTVQDENGNKTLIEITAPTEGLVEELMRTGAQLEAVAKRGDASSIKMIYELAAKLMNYNRSFFKTTAEELRDKYKMSMYGLVRFFRAYFDFIEEINSAKN